jgi:general secretion pathway protein D
MKGSHFSSMFRQKKSLSLFCLACAATATVGAVGYLADSAEAQSTPPPPPPPPPPPTSDTADDGNIDNPPPPSDDMDASMPPPSPGAGGFAGSKSAPTSKPAAPQSTGAGAAPGKKVAPGKELVSIDFPEPTELKDIIKAVGSWTGRNFILNKSISAKVQIISPQLVTKEEAYQAFLSALNVAGFTTVETGKFVKIVPTSVAPGANIKTFYGGSWAPATDETITQIIPLTYIQATEIATNIKNTLRLSTNIAAFPATNSLIVTDTGHKVRRLLEVIRILDIKGNQPQLALEPIRNSDAGDIAKKIQDLFGARGSQSPYLQKVIIDQRSNSLLLVGPPKGLDDVVRVIRRLDQSTDDAGSQAQIHIRPLEYADAEKLSQTLTSLATGMRQSGSNRSRPSSSFPSVPGQPGTASVASLGDLKIAFDKPTNSLIIQGSKSAYLELENIIQVLDKRREQVYIEVDILDINIGNDLNLGMSVLAGGTANNGRFAVPFGWKPGATAPFAVDLGGSATAEQKALQLKAIPNQAFLGLLGTKSISVGGMKISPGAFIFALKSDSNSNVLQTPNLLVADNEEATFDAIERSYYKNRTVDQSTKIASDKWEPTDANLSLQIKPQISKADFVNMDIKLTAERFDSRQDIETPPARNTRKSNTKVTVQNQQTIVISGLTRDVETDTKSKVPLLGDIPILGWLFRDTSKKREKTNLTIFITPYVIRDSSDLSKIYEKKVADRDEFLKAFYGSDMRGSEVFSHMPNKERGKVPPLKITPQPGVGPTEGSSKGGDRTKLPSEDADPVVVPGGSTLSGGGGSAPVFGDGGGGDVAPVDSAPPPPPPPPPVSEGDAP